MQPFRSILLISYPFFAHSGKITCNPLDLYCIPKIHGQILETYPRNHGHRLNLFLERNASTHQNHGHGSNLYPKLNATYNEKKCDLGSYLYPKLNANINWKMRSRCRSISKLNATNTANCDHRSIMYFNENFRS